MYSYCVFFSIFEPLTEVLKFTLKIMDKYRNKYHRDPKIKYYQKMQHMKAIKCATLTLCRPESTVGMLVMCLSIGR